MDPRMRHKRGPWYESDNPDRWALHGIAWWVVALIATVLAAALVGGIVWGVRVLTSDARGAGDAVIEKNSGRNRIDKQEQFEKLYADLQATDSKLDTLAADAKAHPTDTTARTTYTGTVTYCKAVAGDYNALARSYTAEQFRAADLPTRIDLTGPNADPTTDCKENQQ